MKVNSLCNPQYSQLNSPFQLWVHPFLLIYLPQFLDASLTACLYNFNLINTLSSAKYFTLLFFCRVMKITFIDILVQLM